MRCFSLLARDEDFDYINGELWVNPQITSHNWDGLQFEKGRVRRSSSLLLVFPGF
jgi:hypothetical protein